MTTRIEFADLTAYKRPIVGGSPMTTLAQVQAQILAAAVSQLGVPYVFGGETPGVGFDCSGLTQWSCAQVGVSIPRGSADQFNLSPYQVKDGTFDIADLVFFEGGELAPPRPGHVGLVSDPATLTMIQAPFTGEDVSYAKFDPTITTGALAYFGSTRPALARGPFTPPEEDEVKGLFIRAEPASQHPAIYVSDTILSIKTHVAEPADLQALYNASPTDFANTPTTVLNLSYATVHAIQGKTV